jgi:hypothetical protein
MPQDLTNSNLYKVRFHKEEQSFTLQTKVNGIEYKTSASSSGWKIKELEEMIYSGMYNITLKSSSEVEMQLLGLPVIFTLQRTNLHKEIEELKALTEQLDKKHEETCNKLKRIIYSPLDTESEVTSFIEQRRRARLLMRGT